MHIRTLMSRINSAQDRLLHMVSALLLYAKYGVSTEIFTQELKVLDRIVSKLEAAIENGPEMVNPKWMDHVLEVAEARIASAIRMERGFLLNPYIRGLLRNRIYEVTQDIPDARERLFVEMDNFDKVRSEKETNSILRESFKSLVDVLEQCERRAAMQTIDSVMKPTPPAPAKRDRKADRREADREIRDRMKSPKKEVPLHSADRHRPNGKKARKAAAREGKQANA